MNRTYRDLLKHSGVYGIGQILTRLTSFLLLPLYTNYLTPADYGCIAILDLTTNVLGILIGAGMVAAVKRHHFDSDNESDRDGVWWTGITFVAFSATTLVLPLWLARDLLASVTLGDSFEQGGFYYALVLSTLWCTIVGKLPNSYLRVRKWSSLSVALAFAGLLLNIGLNVYFLVFLQMGISGILIGNLIAGATMMLVYFGIFAVDRGPYRFAPPLLKELCRFGWPLIITALLATVMHQADRYFLRLFLDMEQVGLYSIAYQIGHAINTLCIMPFAAIWGVAIYEIAKLPDAKRVYATVFEYFAYGLMLAVLAVSLFIKPVLSLMTPPEYAGAAHLVPIISLAYFFFSLNDHFRVPVMLAKKTVAMLPVSGAAAATNVVCNFALIPLFGVYGAAWASVATFFVFAFFGLYRYRRIDRFHYPFARCGTALLAMAATYLIFRFLDSLGIPHPWIDLIGLAFWTAWAILLFGRLLISRQFGLQRFETVPAEPTSAEQTA